MSFDLFNPTKAEVDELIDGYGDGFGLLPPTRESAAYNHGWIIGWCDHLGITLEFQRELIRDERRLNIPTP